MFQSYVSTTCDWKPCWSCLVKQRFSIWTLLLLLFLPLYSTLCKQSSKEEVESSSEFSDCDWPLVSKTSQGWQKCLLSVCWCSITDWTDWTFWNTDAYSCLSDVCVWSFKWKLGSEVWPRLIIGTSGSKLSDGLEGFLTWNLRKMLLNYKRWMWAARQTTACCCWK